jgi:DNA mismatch repair protein MutS
VFLRRLEDGGASRSYGIHCARLAGLPERVVRRAGELLARLERTSPDGERRQLGLFVGGWPAGAVAPDPVRSGPEPAFAADAEAVLARLRAVDPDGLTPRDAHALVYELRAQLTRRSP